MMLKRSFAFVLQADWNIVEKGWKAHVLGEAPHKFKDAKTAVTSLRVSNLLLMLLAALAK